MKMSIQNKARKQVFALFTVLTEIKKKKESLMINGIKCKHHRRWSIITKERKD